eukprot:2155578-Rhodomonas_salina.1
MEAARLEQEVAEAEARLAEGEAGRGEERRSEEERHAEMEARIVGLEGELEQERRGAERLREMCAVKVDALPARPLHVECGDAHG